MLSKDESVSIMMKKKGRRYSLFESKFLRYFNGVITYIQEWTNSALLNILPPMVGRQRDRGINARTKRRMRIQGYLINIRASPWDHTMLCSAGKIRNKTDEKARTIYLSLPRSLSSISSTHTNKPEYKFGILTTFWIAIWIKKVEKRRNFPWMQSLYDFIKWKTRENRV